MSAHVIGSMKWLYHTWHDFFYKKLTFEEVNKWNYTETPTIEPYWFEKCNLRERTEWFIDHWTLCLWVTSIYIPLIFGLQRWMKNRPAFKLTGLLFFWNAGHALFSIAASTRTLPELLHILAQDNGFYRSICIRENFHESSAFWGWLYMWSKIVELGDTLFIVLKKRELLFLHWWHHVTVLNAIWITCFHMDPIARWFALVNITIHSLMYSYYALKAANIYVPRRVAMALTILQIGQMVWAVYLNFLTIYLKWFAGIPCERDYGGVMVHFMCYLSYLILFARFFYDAYLRAMRRRENENRIIQANENSTIQENHSNQNTSKDKTE